MFILTSWLPSFKLMNGLMARLSRTYWKMENGYENDVLKYFVSKHNFIRTN